MRKSTLFLSAVLTTFVMAMLTGLVSAYQGILPANSADASASSDQAQTQVGTSSVANTLPTQVQPTEAQSVNWTPEQAAALASQVLGREDLYSVEVADLNGETVYLVTFSSGDLVYVSLDGQILSIGKVQVETVVVKAGNGGGGNDGGGNNPPPKRGHEDDDHEKEHEEHED